MQIKQSFLNALAFILGFTSIISQVVLLRELIIVFYGNETAYAIILASWLFWVAVGSFAASCFVGRIKQPLKVLSWIHVALFFVLPITLVFLRVVKQVMRIPTGEIVGIIPVCVVAYLVLAPLAVLLGGLFTLACRASQEKREGRPSEFVGSIYLWESIGASVGGFLFSCVFVHFIPMLVMVFLLGVVNLGVFLFLCFSDRKWLRKGIAALVLFSAICSFWGGEKLDQWTRAVQWKGFNVVAVEDSIYGNIVLTKDEAEYSLFENGLLSFTTGDDLNSEESIHLPFSQHPSPEKVLLIGNGLGGALREALKYPQVHVDYVELDSKVVEVSRQYLSSEDLSPLDDERVAVYHLDARWFIKRTQKTYDVIVVNLSDPYTAMLNRYYSLEFFQEASRILKEEGILALRVSSAENYLNREAKAFLRSIHTTLKNVFVDVKSIPGDTHAFFACKNTGVLTADPDVLSRRLARRDVNTKYVREYYLPYKMSEDRLSYIEEVLAQEGEINTDMKPIAYLYDIVLWSTHFDTAFRNIFSKIAGVRCWHLFVIPLVVLIFGLYFQRRWPALPVGISILTTGFSEIVFQVIVILAFQALYGYAYYKVGLIMTSFMTGLVLGSFVAKKIIVVCPQRGVGIYKITQAAICIYPLLLPVVFVVFRDMAVTQRWISVFATTFAMLPIVAGFIGGLQYPLAAMITCVINPNKQEGAARSAGVLYGMDVLGATVGALLAGTFLIPLWGIVEVVIFCAVLNGAVFFVLLPLKQTK